MNNTEHIFSYGGTTQYSRDGTGALARGLVARYFATMAFSVEQGGLQDTALLQLVFARECTKVRRLYTSISLSDHISIPEGNHLLYAHWSGNLHLEVGDIGRVPLFETMKLKTTTYDLRGVTMEFLSSNLYSRKYVALRLVSDASINDCFVQRESSNLGS